MTWRLRLDANLYDYARRLLSYPLIRRVLVCAPHCDLSRRHLEWEAPKVLPLRAGWIYPLVLWEITPFARLLSAHLLQ